MIIPSQQRRASDHRPLDIEAMIAEENDPKQRAFLIVLNSINNSLMANTKTTTDVAAKLDDHLSRYEEHTSSEAALFNKGVGAWKVMAWVLGTAQSLMGGGLIYLINDLRDIHQDVRVVQSSGLVTAEKIRTIERQLLDAKPSEKEDK